MDEWLMDEDFFHPATCSRPWIAIFAQSFAEILRRHFEVLYRTTTTVKSDLDRSCHTPCNVTFFFTLWTRFAYKIFKRPSVHCVSAVFGKPGSAQYLVCNFKKRKHAPPNRHPKVFFIFFTQCHNRWEVVPARRSNMYNFNQNQTNYTTTRKRPCRALARQRWTDDIRCIHLLF